MRKLHLILFLLPLFFSGKLTAQPYQVYVANASDFDLTCEGHTEKGEGAFSKYTPLIKKGNAFSFICTPLKGGLPKGVEGTIAFRLPGSKYNGTVKVYFDNPLVGDPEFKLLNADWPFVVEQLDKNKVPNEVFFTNASAAIKISIDTAEHHPASPVPLPVQGSSNPTGGVPLVINFDWEVDQRMTSDEGKGYRYVKYFFTTNGEYAAMKPEDDGHSSMSMMVYAKNGQTWLLDDKAKTITIMNMPKTIGEGAMLGKQFAESMTKKPLQKDKDDEKYTVIKTGKTKIFMTYTAEEYLMTNNNVNATKNAAATASFWYAKVPFDPIKIYTMGAGRPADLTKLENDPKMKNNIFAVPILNLNYLWIETEAAGKKGMEVTGIIRRNTTIYTAGYKIKEMKSLRDMMKGGDDNYFF